MATLILRPNSDSSVTQSTFGSSNHWDNVDDVSESTADYNYNGDNANTSHLDIYGFPDHTTESGVISSVVIKAQAKCIQSGDTTTVYINPTLKTGGL